MSTLALALILPLISAAAYGALLGLAAARGRSEFASGQHPVLDALLKRRSAFFNAVFAVFAWGVVLYVVPKLSFALFGIEDLAAFGLSAALQLCILAIAFLCAERVWARIA
jgi:hypothetical protein